VWKIMKTVHRAHRKSMENDICPEFETLDFRWYIYIFFYLFLWLDWFLYLTLILFKSNQSKSPSLSIFSRVKQACDAKYPASMRADDAGALGNRHIGFIFINKLKFLSLLWMSYELTWGRVTLDYYKDVEEIYFIVPCSRPLFLTVSTHIFVYVTK
jgi:hypothetical protein